MPQRPSLNGSSAPNDGIRLDVDQGRETLAVALAGEPVPFARSVPPQYEAEADGRSEIAAAQLQPPVLGPSVFLDDRVGSIVGNHKVTVAAPANRYFPSGAQVTLPSRPDAPSVVPSAAVVRPTPVGWPVASGGFVGHRYGHPKAVVAGK